MPKPTKKQQSPTPPTPINTTDSRLAELQAAFQDATRSLTRLGNALNHYYYDTEQLSATEKLKAAKDILKDYV